MCIWTFAPVVLPTAALSTTTSLPREIGFKFGGIAFFGVELIGIARSFNP